MEKEKNKFLSKEEISKLPEKYVFTKKAKILIFVATAIVLIGILMLTLGIVFLIQNGEDGFVILITFGSIVLICGLITPIFIQSDKSKDQEVKKILIKQAINESFKGRVIYQPYSSVSSNILREFDVCPFDAEKGGEKLLVSKDKGNLSILEISSSNNIKELIQLGLITLEGGVFSGAFISLITLAQKAQDKSLLSKGFNGTIMVFPNIRKYSKSIVEVRSKKFFTPLSSKFSNSNKFETEDIKANEKYNFYASDLSEGFVAIKPLMIQTINEIHDLLKNGFIMIFMEDFLVLAFSDEKININKISKNNKITAKSAYNLINHTLSKYNVIADLIFNNFYNL